MAIRMDYHHLLLPNHFSQGKKTARKLPAVCTLPVLSFLVPKPKSLFLFESQFESVVEFVLNRSRRFNLAPSRLVFWMHALTHINI
jgi:hypothetical protein